MFSKEEYDVLKIKMQAHLAAHDDDMWFIIKDGPIKIMRPNTAVSMSVGATHVRNSSVLLVQADEGVSVLVVDRIGDIYRSLPRRADVIVTTVGARHKCQQGSGFEPPISENENRETTTGPPPRVAELAAARFRTHAAQHHAHQLRMVAEVLAVPRASRCAHHHRHRPPSRATCCAMRRAVTPRLARLVRPMMLRRCAHDSRPLHSCLRRWALAGRKKRREVLRDGGARRVRRCAPIGRRAALCRAQSFEAAPPPAVAPASLLRCHDG
ncbi:hypothetical protein F511_23379 [Dorcoceras hygrometricum]|uniref:Uncharacterized protein n=1 Tax=Dorcoceras hygrometricum TaxID=472368 RepID=A0A2Z7B7L6_9LAMI|nr:hypothetical protein F511_23379 [Dorcoceras hygrometricum]